MVDRPRSAVSGRWLVRKFRLDRIYSFGYIAIFMFRGLGLKLSIHAHFRGFGGIFPQMTSPIVLTPHIQRQVWFIPFADERVGVQIKL